MILCDKCWIFNTERHGEALPKARRGPNLGLLNVSTTWSIR
jgi:hypothetical protein